MFRQKFGLVAFALALGTSPLSAADDSVPGAFDTGRLEWQGSYVGAQLGYDWLDANSGFFSTKADGVVGGFHAGYLFKLGEQFYLGPEVSAELSSMAAATFETDYLLAARLRGGIAFDRLLVTGSVGLSHAKFSSPVFGTYSSTGWLVGVGADYAITDHLTAGIDYSYHVLDDFDNSGVDVEMSLVRARIGYRF